MLKRIISGLIAIVLIALCYVGYNRYRRGQEMMSGVVGRGPSEAGDTSDSDVPVAPRSASTKSTASVGSPPPGSVDADQQVAPSGAPASDSMRPNPPNGMAYAGVGHFQVYRQGNLTYRINTDTGQTCVLYATNDEWRKQQVYSHGCGRSATQ